MGKTSRDKKKQNALARLGGSTVGATSRREAFARVRESVVGIIEIPPEWEESAKKGQAQPITKLRLIGTGFIVPGNIVLTAKHVVQGFMDAFQAWQADQTVPPPRGIQLLFSTSFLGTQGNDAGMQMEIGAASQFSFANEHDLAALRIATPPPGTGFTIPRPIQISNSASEEGDEVAVCGYPLGLSLHSDLLGGQLVSPSFSKGIVSAVLPHPAFPVGNRTVLQIDAIINPGNSGGPVFDVRTGNAVGIVTGRTELSIRTAPGQLLGGEDRITIPIGLARALPIHLAKVVIDSLNQLPPPRPPEPVEQRS